VSGYEPQIGDRVLVTFEGEVASCFGGKYVLVRDKGFWGTGSIEADNVVSVRPL
jgi:hypothetical protein